MSTDRLWHEVLALFGDDVVAEAEALDLNTVTAEQARAASVAAKRLRAVELHPEIQRIVVDEQHRSVAVLLARRLLDPDATAQILSGLYSSGRRCTQTPKRSRTVEVLTPEEVAEILKVTPATVRKLLRDGELPGRKIGKSWRVTRQALEAYLMEPSGDGERGKG